MAVLNLSLPVDMTISRNVTDSEQHIHDTLERQDSVSTDSIKSGVDGPLSQHVEHPDHKTDVERNIALNMFPVIPNMSESLTFEFPWSKESEKNESLEVTSKLEGGEKDSDGKVEVVDKSKQNEIAVLEEDCCSKVCKEITGEARAMAEIARNMSIKANDFVCEADALSKQASEVSKICDIGVKKETGIFSSIINVISSGSAVKTIMSPKENSENICEIDYSVATDEAKKLLENLENVKLQARKMKELAENASCLDGFFTEEGKQNQITLLRDLEMSKEAVKSTTKLIVDSEHSITSSKSSIQVKTQRLIKGLLTQELGMLVCGIGFGTCCGFIVGHIYKKVRKQKFGNTNN